MDEEEKARKERGEPEPVKSEGESASTTEK